MNNPYSPPPPRPNPYGSPQQNPYGSPQQNPYGSPQHNPYGAPQQSPYGAPQQNPYGSPQQNPYGGVPSNPYAPPTNDAPWANPMMGADAMVLAERGTRLGAAIVDSLLYGVVLMVFAIPGAALESPGLVALAFLAMLGLGIYQWVLISTTGQSLAKKWLGIKIVKEDGSPVDFVHGVLLRSWVMQFAAGIIPLIGLIDVLMIFGDERRCLHDHLASTKVVVANA